ncbi:hypothetical protein [Psychrobacter sp. I-STPA6b]|uniref:hypothetical protein n=1 Tax=Psychrobacter sp. I-STPA6b TaxID=2585718 RepID=UPI001D0C427B|nr:hypothetical protein [Psychrobacter sp. I-STPA6b]
MRESRSKTAQGLKPVTPVRQKLKLVWVVWLLYRLIALPILVSQLSQNNPEIMGGIVWQAIWLLPAFVLTPWMVKGKSPYALLLASMITLVYMGASGVVLFTRLYAEQWSISWIYMIDTLLLLGVNILLFVLLKRLPSMNKARMERH